MMTLQQIRYFIAVSEAGQVTAAARNMNISQSAITLAIKDLETQLATNLFERHANGLSLTHSGQLFLSHAKNIEVSVGNAIESVKHKTEVISGGFRLGVTHTLSGYFLFPILSKFQRLFPEVEISLVELKRDDLEKQLISGKIDIGLLVKANIERKQDITYRTFHRSSRSLWLSINHPLLEKDKIYLKDLLTYPYVSLKADECELAAKVYWKNLQTKPKEVFSTTSIEAVRNMVSIGSAITILSDVLFRQWSLDGKRLEKRPIADKIPDMEVGVSWRKGKKMSKTEKSFYTMLTDNPHSQI